jgi:hypothetical protein
MKRSAVLLMIPVLAIMLTVPALASANWYYWWGILGTWEMVATGGCIHAPSGFEYNEATRTWTANPSNWWTSTYVGQGTFTFDVVLAPAPYQGYRTGTMKVTQNCAHSNGKVIQNFAPPPVLNLETFPLFWKLEDGGAMTVKIPNVGLELSGKVSLDYISMTLVSMNQLQHVADPTTKPPTPLYDQVCAISRVLFRVKE